MRKTDRLLFATGAAFIAGYFLLLTRQAVRGYFSPDDLMNLYRAWSPPLGQLFTGNLFFFLHSPYYRPMGEAWYRVIYFFAGFHPQPFKIANLAFLLANLFLTYCVARRLSQSRAVGALATLLVSYHGAFAPLYFDSGYIYDVLCYFFYFAAMAWYLRIRQQDRFLRGRELGVLCALYICALDSKEMAVSLPVSLLAYELLFAGKAKGWLAARRWWPALITGAMTAVFIAGRILSPDSLMSQHIAYHPAFTWSRFMETSLRFAGDLFYTNSWFTPARLIVIWAALLAYAWVDRSPVLCFAWLFSMVAPLPVAFLPARGAPQYYLPLFGWALYAAALLMSGIEAVLGKVPTRHRHWATQAAAAALVAAIAGTTWARQKDAAMSGVPAIREEAPAIRLVNEQLHALYPRLPTAARLFFLDDRVLPPWDVYFLVKLSYGTDLLDIETDRDLDSPPAPDQLASYDHVFDFRGGHLLEWKRPFQPALIPAIELASGRPQVFHDGFVPVTGDCPARAGEFLITRAFDLGDTDPRVQPGQRFPRNPLARVTAVIEVRVNGQRAQTGAVIGWPGEINRYRVDVRLPQDTPSGMAKVTVTAGGITGPPVEIPVQSPLPARVASPAIMVEAGRPQVFHADWSPVTREHPARPGEDVITKAIDLGDTHPRVPPGTPFPKAPFADVIARVDGGVGGRPARTSVQIGWPDTIGQYRVDIHIPDDTPAGAARITLRVNGVTGPAVEIPIKRP